MELYSRVSSPSGAARERKQPTLTPRFGKKAMPLCGSPDLYSDKNSNLSFSYSKYRMLPSLRILVSLVHSSHQTIYHPSLVHTYPLPARYRQFVPSSQKGMHTPEIESRLLKPPIGLSWPGSHSAS